MPKSRCADHAQAQALSTGSRILSSYEIAPGVAIWIITDAESQIDSAGNVLRPPRRLSTTILRPEDY